MGLIFKKSTAQPEFTVAAAISGTVQSFQTLTATATIVREKPGTIRYFWHRHTATDGSDPVGELVGTDQTYVPTAEDVGYYLRVIIDATNPAGRAESISSFTAAVASATPPTQPTIATPASITGTPDVGQTVGVTFDFDGETSVRYQWYSYDNIDRANPVAMGTASTQALTETDGPYIGVEVFGQNSVGETMTRDVVPMVGADPWEPVPPTEYTVPAYDLTGMNIIDVESGDDLQVAINAAMPGDVLRLEAGATWSGDFYFPNTNADGSDWIYVISSAMASLPAEGTRVTSSDASHMPKIIASAINRSAMRIRLGAKKVRFVGVEFSTVYDQRTGVQYTFMPVGDGGDDGPADEIIFDRCYIHGTATGNNRDGLVLYRVTNFALIDSAVQDFHGVGYEAHAVHVYWADGPTLLRNNLIEACGINVFIGDSSLSEDSVPRNVTVLGNLIRKPLSWRPGDDSYAGIPWLVKNLFESKGVLRLRVEANIFENSWEGAQSGGVMTLMAAGWSLTDIEVKNNVIRNFPGTAVFISPSADTTLPTNGISRVKIENNCIYNAGLWRVAANTNGIGMTTSAEKRSYYVRIAHNSFATATVRPTASAWASFAGYPVCAENIDVRDNLYTVGSRNISSSGTDSSTNPVTALNTRFTGEWYYRNNCAIEAVYPFVWFSGTATANIYDNINATTRTIAKVADNSLSSPSHFVLDPTSPAAGAATDETDMGCDISTLLSTIALYNDTTP